MPTRTTDTQTYQNQSIQCAKFVSDEPFVWKAAKVVQAETDYFFEFVVKSSANASLTIQVGDIIKNQAVTTDWTKYVIDFPAVTNNVDSLYITFPAGTYWTYNVQLEQAQTPSSWRPAPEDAEDYADEAGKKAVDAQTQIDVFNKLTNNGQAQGIYILDGQLYINGEYIASKTITGDKIFGGEITGITMNIGNGTFVIDEDGKVTAANINITGGSIRITTDDESADIIQLTYNGYDIMLRPQKVIMKHYNSVNQKTRRVEITPYSVDAYTDTNTHAYNLSIPSSDSSSSSAGLALNDGAGTMRAMLTSAGLKLYDASGNLVKTYGPT